MIRFLLLLCITTTFCHAQNATYLGMTGSQLATRPEFTFTNGSLYFETSNGLYTKSISSSGTEWTRVTRSGTVPIGYILKGDSILISTIGGLGNCLELSTDNGNSWTNHTNGFGGNSITNFIDPTELAQHPENPKLIYGLAGNCVARSTDFGNSWTPVKNSWGAISYQPLIMKIHPLKPDWIFSGGEAGNFHSYLDISYDAGQNWNQYAYEDNNAVNCLEFSPADPAIMLIGKEGKIDRSIDSGKTWTTVFKPPHTMYIHAIDYPFSYSNDVYAAGAYNNVSFAKDTVHLFRSPDKGASWQKIYEEYIQGCGGIREIEIHDSTLYFLTEHKGVYKLALSDLPVGKRNMPKPHNYSIQIRPNSLQLLSNDISPQKVFIYSLQGQLVFESTMYGEPLSISTSHWSTGCYLIAVRGKTHAYQEKVIVVRN